MASCQILSGKPAIRKKAAASIPQKMPTHTHQAFSLLSNPKSPPPTLCPNSNRPGKITADGRSSAPRIKAALPQSQKGSQLGKEPTLSSSAQKKASWGGHSTRSPKSPCSGAWGQMRPPAQHSLRRGALAHQKQLLLLRNGSPPRKQEGTWGGAPLSLPRPKRS